MRWLWQGRGGKGFEGLTVATGAIRNSGSGFDARWGGFDVRGVGSHKDGFKRERGVKVDEVSQETCWTASSLLWHCLQFETYRFNYSNKQACTICNSKKSSVSISKEIGIDSNLSSFVYLSGIRNRQLLRFPRISLSFFVTIF